MICLRVKGEESLPKKANCLRGEWRVKLFVKEREIWVIEAHRLLGLRFSIFGAKSEESEALYRDLFDGIT